MKILDLSAGNRAVWFDKNNPLTTFLDKRQTLATFSNATLVCDTNSIPDIAGSGYDLIVFDPPHMNCGPNSNMSKRYGYHTTKEILELVEKTSKEAHRVSRDGALMALKWNDHDIKLQKVLDLMCNWEPLFGHSVSYRTKHKSQTYWVMLRRIT